MVAEHLGEHINLAGRYRRPHSDGGALASASIAMADEKAMRRLRIENRRAKTAAQRSALKARYGAQTNLSDGDDRCCCVSAVSVRITVNLMFCVSADARLSTPAAAARTCRLPSPPVHRECIASLSRLPAWRRRTG